MAGLIAAIVVAAAWCWFATWLGPRVGYVDRPDGSSLKIHETPAVPLGGVGVFAGFHLGSWIEGGFDWVFFGATAIVLVLGLIDDRRGLPPVIRLGFEVAAAVVLVVGLLGGSATPLEMIYCVVLAVFAINAVNLFDGLDGLAASVGAVAAVGLAVLSVSRGVDYTVPALLAASLVGFLVLGWNPARVFLGDAGAYVVGVLLAASIMTASPDAGSRLLVASGMLGVFAVDLMVTVLRRLRSRSPLFEGDRSHLYDQLMDRGLSVRQVVFVAVAAQAAVVALVLAADNWMAGTIAVALLLAVFGVAVVSLAVGRTTKPDQAQWSDGPT